MHPKEMCTTSGTETERLLIDIWQVVLQPQRRLVVTDDYFELGGDSVRAIRILARLRKATGLDLPLRVIFETPTISTLAQRIDAILWAMPQQQPLVSNGLTVRDEGELS